MTQSPESAGPTLQEAIDHLWHVAVRSGRSQSGARLTKLADYCVAQLARRGLRGAEKERTLPGGVRPKCWDIAWKHAAKYRLAVSLKSILANLAGLAGTVPNRLDDLMGEVSNLQMYSPEIVIGYVMVFDVSQDTPSTRRGGGWCDSLERRLTTLSGRSAPAWSTGMIEAFSLIRVDFSAGPKLLTPEDKVAAMFDVLVAEVKQRNPSAEAQE